MNYAKVITPCLQCRLMAIFCILPLIIYDESEDFGRYLLKRFSGYSLFIELVGFSAICSEDCQSELFFFFSLLCIASYLNNTSQLEFCHR